MEMDDLDDRSDIFDDIQKPAKISIGMQEWVFPIIGKNCPDTGNFSNGTGFFINNDGYFITAGHVLINQKECYKALIDDKEYDIEMIFLEHVEIVKQEFPFCKDLAICKIDYKRETTLTCFFDTTNADEKKLNIYGFKQEPPKIIFERKIVYHYNFPATDEKLKAARLLEDVNGSNIIEDMRPICENTMSLKLQEGIHYNGLSGGPVYFENSIFGMFIGIEYIQSEYIIEKLNQFKIPFNK